MNSVDVEAQLAAWRRDGADRVAPLQFARIGALAERSARADGALRRQLDARVASLVQGYAALLRDADAAHAARSSRTPRQRPAGLPHLLVHLSSQAAPRAGSEPGPDPCAEAPVPHVANTALDEVRRLSLHARTGSQLRQALEPAAGDMGPLNSASLVHRALQLMQDASPGYLAAFLGYVDTLASIEQLAPPGAPAPSERGPSGSRPAKPRTRRRSPGS